MKSEKDDVKCPVCGKPKYNGFKGRCRKCQYAYKKAYDKAYKKTDKYKAYDNAYQKAYQKAYYQKNRENILARIKKTQRGE